MLDGLLAHIISRHPAWSNAKIRLLRVIGNKEGREQTEAHLRELLERVRVKAEAVVLVSPEGRDIAITIHEQSRHTDLTILGINRVDAESAAGYA